MCNLKNKNRMVIRFFLLVYSAITIGMQLEPYKQIAIGNNCVDFSVWCPQPIRKVIGEYVLLTGSTKDVLHMRMVAKVFNEDMTFFMNSLQEEELRGWWNNLLRNSGSSSEEIIFLDQWHMKVGACCKTPHMLQCHLKRRGKFDLNTLLASYLYIDKLCALYKVNPTKKDCYAKCTSILFLTDCYLSIGDRSAVGNIFHKAVTSGHYCLIKLLIQKGVDANICNSWGMTPLHSVCDMRLWSGKNRSEDIEKIVSLLVAHGALINAKDSIENTPLHIACRATRLSVVKWLVAYGADLQLRNMYTLTSLEVAREIDSFNEHIISYLEQVTASRTK